MDVYQDESLLKQYVNIFYLILQRAVERDHAVRRHVGYVRRLSIGQLG